MSGSLQFAGGESVIEDGWRKLREAVRDLADGYAGTDPRNAYRYRDEAAEFCGLLTPADRREFEARQEEAETLRRCWSARLRRSKSQ
jgi:hypothetical protein